MARQVGARLGVEGVGGHRSPGVAVLEWPRGRYRAGWGWFEGPRGAEGREMLLGAVGREGMVRAGGSGEYDLAVGVL